MEQLINKWTLAALYSDTARTLAKRLVYMVSDLDSVQTDSSGQSAVADTIKMLKGAHTESLLAKALDCAKETLVFCAQTHAQRLAAESEINAEWREAGKGHQ